MLTVYKSSAGAGKTFRLTGNFIDLLLSAHGRNRHRRILAVTFTKKATAEMKDRIIKELSRLARGEESDHAKDLKEKHGLSDEQLQHQASEILTDLLQDYGAFAVTTIDSFFQQILRSFARELNLPGSYNLELDSGQILQTAVDDYFFNLSSDQQSDSFRALMRIVDENIEQSRAWNPKDTILTLGNELLKEKYQTHQKELEEKLSDPEALNHFQDSLRQIRDDYLAEYRQLEKQMMQCLGGVSESDFLRGALTPFHFDEKAIVDYAKDSKPRANFMKLVETPEKMSGNTEVQQVAFAIQPLAEKLYAMLSGEQTIMFVSACAALRYIPYLRILQDVSYYIRKTNTELNRLPISETNALLEDVVSEQGDTPFVYDKIGTRVSHYMIDEFQDTSSMQWHNFRPLIRESLSRAENNLVVGDVKQSIYRWRNSDSRLLQYGVNNDFPDSREELLGKNWRSDKVIVEENGKIFSALAKKIQALFDERSDTANHRILNMYSSVEQEVTKSDQGYLQIKFIEGDKAEVRQQIVDELPNLLNEMFSRKVKPGQVALLVRKNSEAQILADALLANNIKVMSNEGLLLTSSHEVRLVVDLLRLRITPDDKILRLQTAYEYALVQGMKGQEALSAALNEEVVIPQIPTAPSLEEQVSCIIDTLRLEAKVMARPYLQAFQDCVYSYVQKNAADVYSFIDWWDKRGSETTIQMQPSDDAVQILTVHKSKGLEYDVVIIPFCDWYSAESGHTNILWVEPRVAPFNKMPVLPVRFGGDLSASVFRDDYLQELENLYVDNLNLTYVAFTRAKHELYVFAPYSVDKNKKTSLSTMGGVLYEVLKNEISEGVYSRGEHLVVEPIDQKETPDREYPVVEYAPKEALRVKLPSRDYFLRENPDDLSSRVNLGSVMHELLCHVSRLEDIDNAVDRMLREGRITADDLQIIKTELARFRRLVADTDWFDSKWQVINEHDILLPDGSIRRPDRVLISGTEAVVVDYKFGLLQSEEYPMQVGEYMQLLSQMGYHVRGYLCYVNLKTIKEVTL